MSEQLHPMLPVALAIFGVLLMGFSVLWLERTYRKLAENMRANVDLSFITSEQLAEELLRRDQRSVVIVPDTKSPTRAEVWIKGDAEKMVVTLRTVIETFEKTPDKWEDA